MNRETLSLLLIVAFAASAVLDTTYLVFRLYQKDQKEQEAHIKKLEYLNALIGKKVVLDRDTLTIIKYSTLFGEITLSNGRKADIRYIEKPGVLIK